jgi:hypothetical protein
MHLVTFEAQAYTLVVPSSSPKLALSLRLGRIATGHGHVKARHLRPVTQTQPDSANKDLQRHAHLAIYQNTSATRTPAVVSIGCPPARLWQAAKAVNVTTWGLTPYEPSFF